MTKALVIEDNPDNMTLICDILELSGHDIVTATSGIQGFEVARKARPDFIVLDIQLPDIDGSEVLDMIRADAGTRRIPVIAMTSYAMSGDKERLLKAGCDGYIEKPINPGLVVRQIKQAIENKS